LKSVARCGAVRGSDRGATTERTARALGERGRAEQEEEEEKEKGNKKKETEKGQSEKRPRSAAQHALSCSLR
jgi:hypothetical protein